MSAPTSQNNRRIITTLIEWRGIQTRVSFEPDWLNTGRENRAFATAHLQIESVAPERAPLPITETGYRSHFIPCGTVEEAGGPEAYVRAWLDHEAAKPAWKAAEAAARQLSLF